MEHLGLLDLALSSVLAGVRLAGVVPTFAHTHAEQAVSVGLLDVEHAVVDVQHADTTHQPRGDPGPLPDAEQQKTQ